MTWYSDPGDLMSLWAAKYKCTRVSVATATLVIVDQLHAVEAAGGVAGPRQAFIEISLTVFSNISWRAGARVTADTVHTLSSVPTARLPGARLGCAVVRILFTLEPCRAENTSQSFLNTKSVKLKTLVICSTMSLTFILHYISNLCVCVCVCVYLCGYAICSLTVCSRWTGTGEEVDEVDTGPSMQAGFRVTFIHIILTVHPLVAWFTL